MSNQIRIVFVGDAKCGKSSLINSILHKPFEEECQSIIEESTIQVGEENPITVILNDSCSGDERNHTILNLLGLADVVVYVIDSVDVVSTKLNVDEWLRVINSQSIQVPVIVVAEKVDCLNEFQRTLVREFFAQLLVQSPKIEVCLECSSKTQHNVDSIVDYAVKLTKYPLDPLLNRNTTQLTTEASRCLMYVFRYFNKSHSRYLDNSEFCSFYKTCYGRDINDGDIHDLVHQLAQLGFDCIQGISEGAFLELMRNYLLHDQQEMVWSVIRSMNFSDDLQFQTKVELPDKDAMYELTIIAEKFLISVFKSFDRSGRGYLTLSDLGDLFATTVDYPWSLSISQGNIFAAPDFLQNMTFHDEVHIDAISWLNEWKLLMRTDPACTIQQLLELGWYGSMEELYMVKADKTDEWQVSARCSRRCMQALVIGCEGVGKTALLNRFVNKPISSEMEGPVNTVVNMIQENAGINTLCLTEVQESEALNMLTKYKRFCDIVCCVFDVTRPETFTWIQKMLKQMEDGTKVLLIGTKTDLLTKSYETTSLYTIVNKTVMEYTLEQPLITSYYSKDPLYSVIFKCAIYSELCEKRTVEEQSHSSGWVLPVLSTMGLLVSGYFIWRHRKSHVCSKHFILHSL